MQLTIASSLTQKIIFLFFTAMYLTFDTFIPKNKSYKQFSLFILGSYFPSTSYASKKLILYSSTVLYLFEDFLVLQAGCTELSISQETIIKTESTINQRTNLYI